MNTHTAPTTNANTTKNHRARWAAIGAAVAVSIGAGGFGIAGATSPDGASTLVPIDPCRIADTRPTQQIGLKTDSFGPGETHTVQTQGTNTGQCDPLPNDATALALNVTAVGASELTHLTFWASGPVPNSSSLNPAPGQPPTPNAVNVDLAGDGSFNVFNFAGNVELIIDVVGYYTDNFRIDSTQITDEAGVAFSSMTDTVDLGAADQVVASTSIRVPADGYLTMHVSGRWHPANFAGLDRARCQLTLGDTFDPNEPYILLNDFEAGNVGQVEFSTHRTVPVSAADNPPLFITGQPVNLVCSQVNGNVQINAAHLTAQYFPTSYAPQVIVIGP